MRHFDHDRRPEGKLGESALFSERDLSATDRELLLEEAKKKDASAALKAYAKEVRRAEKLEAKGEELEEQLNAAQERAGKQPTVEEALRRAEESEKAYNEAEESLRKAKAAYTPEREQDALYGEKYALALKAEKDKAQRRRDRAAEKDRANWAALGRARQAAKERTETEKKLRKNTEELDLVRERLAVMEAGKPLQDAAEAARERWWSKDVAEGLRQNRALREANRRLQRTLDWYREQARMTEPEKRKVRRDDIEALAKTLLNEHGSEVDRAWLEERLQAIGDYLVSGDGSTLNAGTLNRMAGELAEELLDNVYAEESDNKDLWKEIRDTVRGTKLVISEELRGDIPDFNDWRKRHKGLFDLVRDRGAAENKAAGALGVDTFYEQLSSSYGEGLFPRSITAQADQLAQIEETLNGLEPTETPFYTRNQLAELTPLVRDEILDVLMSGQVREADTQLERAAKRAVTQARAERDKAREQLRQERATREEQVRRRVERMRERQEASRERQQTIESIRRTQKRLNRFLTENSAKRHIPEGMKTDLGRFLTTLNTLGPFASEERSRDYLDEMDALRQIVQGQGRWLDGESADEGWEGLLLDLPEDLAQAMQDHINRVKEKARADRTWNISRMDLRDLRELEETLTILSTAVTNANILLTDAGSFREIGKLGGQGIRDLGSIRERKSVNRLRNSVSRHVFWANTTPYYFFKRLGTAGEALFKSLTKGWGKLAMNARAIQEFAAKAYSSEEVRAWEKATHSFELRVRLADQSAEKDDGGRSRGTGETGDPSTPLRSAQDDTRRETERAAEGVGPYGEGGREEPYRGGSDAETIRASYNDRSGLETVTMTEAQMMALWCLMRREQAQGHILGAGIKIEEFTNGKFRLNRDAKTYLVTIEDLDAMFDMLSERQKEVCRALQKYMNTVGTNWGNEISLKRYGIRAFTEENYWPIRTDSNSRDARTPDADRANLFRLLNQSFTKSTVRNANNAIVVGSVFDDFANHMADMAKYNALALPMLDATRWFNYRERGESNENGQYTSRSVREAIESAWGREALDYFMTLMQDLNGSSEGGRGDSFLQQVAGANKVASVGANLRVALQQPTSIVRASLLLDGRYLARGAAMKDGTGKALKWSGLANWKDMGYFDVNINRGLREQIKHADNWKETLVEKSMILAEKGDKLTWGALWNACELETRKKNRELTGEELMRKTAERFDEVIMATQVMDSTLTRSQNMRSKGLMSEFTAFMAEPTLTFNTLMDVGFAVDAEARRTDAKTAAIKYAPAALKAGMTFILSGAVTAIAQALGDLLRDDDEYAKWYQTFWNNYKTDFLDNLDPTQLIPVVKDLTNILLRGERKDMMSTLTAQKIYEAAAIWTETAKLAGGTLDKATATTWYGNMTTYGKVYKSLEAVSRLAGLPASAAMRDMVSIWNRTAGELNRELKLKTYDPGEEREIQYAVKDGYLTADEAEALLIERGLASEKEAARTVYVWSQDGGAYDAVKAAALAGDRAAFREASDAMTAAGYREREIRSAVRTAIKDRYQGTDTSGGKLSKAEAITLVQTYGGMTRQDAEKTVQEWTCFVVTGIGYDKIKDELLDGAISRTRAAELWRSYGGYSQEDASDKAGFALYQDEHPNTTLSQATWKGWTERVKPSGVSGESYAKLRKSADADGNGSITQAEAAAALDAEVQAGRLTTKQAEAVWSGFGSTWKTSWSGYKRKKFF